MENQPQQSNPINERALRMQRRIEESLRKRSDDLMQNSQDSTDRGSVQPNSASTQPARENADQAISQPQEIQTQQNSVSSENEKTHAEAGLDQSTEKEIVNNIAKTIGGVSQTQKTAETPKKKWNPSPEEAVIIEDMCNSHKKYMLCIEPKDAIKKAEISSEFIRTFSPIRIGTTNAMSRYKNPSIPPIFQTAHDGDWFAIPLREHSEHYAIVPRFGYTYQQSSHVPGAGMEMFDYANNPTQIYALNQFGKLSSYLKDKYTMYTVLEPCIMKKDSPDNWKIVKKGRLYLGENLNDQTSHSDQAVSEESVDQKEKQRVLGVLLPFYQEQAGETTDHKFLQGLIDDKNKILREALNNDIYITVFPKEKNTQNKLIQMQFDDKPYREIVIGKPNEQGEYQAYSNAIFIEYLTQKINSVFDPQEKERLQNFLNKFSKNEESLHECVEKISKKRIAIGKDILTLSEFSEWKDKDVEIFHHGLYSEDGYSYVDISQADKSEFMNFTLDNSTNNSEQFLDLLKKAQTKFGITDNELKDFPQVVIADVQSILDDIRKIPSVDPGLEKPQPSEDPYALHGGKEEYDKLIADYRKLAELEEKGASKKKHFDWLIMSEERTELYEQWDELRVKIVLWELFSLQALVGKKDFLTLRSIYQQMDSKAKELMEDNIISFLDRNKPFLKAKSVKEDQKESYETSLIFVETAVLLTKRNLVALQSHGKGMNGNMLEYELPISSKYSDFDFAIGKNATDFNFSDLYLFNEEPKSAAATPVTGLDELKQAIKESVSKPKTGQETFLEAATEITNSWDDKQKQTLAKLAEAAMSFQKGYLQKALNQPHLSDEEKETVRKNSIIMVKRYVAERYNDSRLSLPRANEDAIITLIPHLFSD